MERDTFASNKKRRMKRVYGTNGKKIRLMGLIELDNNPDWRLATEADIATLAEGTGQTVSVVGKVVREPEPVSMRLNTQPKEVKEPAKEPEPTKVEASPEGLAKAAEEAEKAAAVPAAQRENVSMVIAKIKQAKTKEQVEAIIAGEDRKTALHVAQQHIENLAKA